MPGEYLSPGVYVEEVSTGPKPISFAPTSTTAFVGFAQKGPFNRPILVTNWSQYRQTFGDFMPGTYLAYAVYGFFQEGGARAYIMRVGGGDGKSDEPTPASLPLGAMRLTARTPGADGRQINVTVEKGAADNNVNLVIKKGDTEEKYENVTIQDAITQINEKSALVRAEVDPSGGNALPAPSPKGKAQNLAGGTGSTANIPVATTTMGPIKLTSTTGGMIANTITAKIYHPEEIGKKAPFSTLVIEKGKVVETFNNVNIDDPASIVEMINNGNEAQGVKGSELVRAELAGTGSVAPNLYRFSGISIAKSTDFTGDTQTAEHAGFDALEEYEDICIVACPDLMAGVRLINGKVHPDDMELIKNVQTAMIAHCEKMHYRVAVVDPPPNMTAQEVRAWRRGEQEFKGKGGNFDSKYAALYWPWVKVADPVSGKQIPVPPSGYMAGIWARNDQTRGVHKAPANEKIRSAVGLEYYATKGENDVLYGSENCNINVIREFPGQGIRVWGARLVSSDPEWRYLNVRRLFNMIEKSIADNTNWVVFEPNDFDLWQRVKRDVSAFLTMCWRNGYLMGRSPGEAFFVKCDEETNPPEAVNLGMLTCEIGICPVKPAEFVIFRIGQWDRGSTVSE